MYKFVEEKRIIAVILYCILCFQSHGQTFGLKAGLNLSNIVVSPDYENRMHNLGFHVSLTMDHPLTKFLSLETGILFTTKGFTRESSLFQGTIKDELYYVDIPVIIMGTKIIGAMKFYASTGPYIGLGLFGKVRTRGAYYDPIIWNDNVDWGNTGLYKRLDFGLTFGCGLGINRTNIGISYDLGLYDIGPTNSDTRKNRVLRFSLGYRFGK